jgi:hypothetical protein
LKSFKIPHKLTVVGRNYFNLSNFSPLGKDVAPRGLQISSREEVKFPKKSNFGLIIHLR